jgi:4,5-dihydroxyphthalate decarboxylase
VSPLLAVGVANAESRPTIRCLTPLKSSKRCGDVDRTRRLLDGSIGIEGYKLEFVTLPPEEMFRRAFEDREFDVSELSMSTFLLHVGRKTCPYVGLPIFPSRAFRHAAIYVRADGSINRPEDLRGRTIGVRNYLNTAALVVRGLLSDEYGVASDEMAWRVGDVNDVERTVIAVPRLERAVDIEALPYGKTLAGQLLDGGIDALVHYEPPRGFDAAGQSQFGRLFPDPAAAERAYFRKTGIFPIMHLIGVRPLLLEQDPALPKKLYDAFTSAKARAVNDLMSQSAPKLSSPWLSDDVARTVALAGPDFWPYGVRKNEAALACLVRYACEQGLTSRLLTMADLFAASLMDT